MSSSKRFEFLSHIADAYVAAYGRTLGEAFESAALSVTEIMTDPATVSEVFEDEISIIGQDEKALLYNWLEQLILNFDIDRRIYSRFKVIRIESENGNWNMIAKAYGEAFDPAKHPSRAEVKAVTYHKMEIREGSNGYVLTFILDL